MKVMNKQLKYALVATIITIIFSLIYSPFGLVFSIITLILGFKSLYLQKENNSFKSKKISIIIIVLAGLFLILNLFTIILVFLATGTVLI